MRRHHPLSLLALLLGTLAALPAHGLDLVEAFKLAQDSDPEYRAAQAAYRAVLEARPQALAGLLPNANLGASTSFNDLDSTRGDSRHNSHGYELSIRQPVFRHDRWVQLQQADTTIQRAEAELESARQQLIERVVTRYFDVLKAQDDLEFARKTKEAIGRQLNQAEQRFDVGLIAITDVEEAKAAFDQAVTSEIQAENAVDSAVESLREVLGEYHRGLAGLGPELPLVRPDPEDIDAWTETAINQNLDLSAALLSAEVARDEIRRLTSSGHYPTVDLVAGRSYSSSGGGNFGAVKSTNDSLGLELSVPLYSGGAASSRVREARHLYQQAQDRVEQNRRAAQRAARNAYLGVNAGISRIQSLKQSLVSTETALKATEAGFQVGTRTTVDVVNAQVDMFRARRDHKAARYDYVINNVALKRAAGTLTDGDLEYFNRWMADAAPVDGRR